MSYARTIGILGAFFIAGVLFFKQMLYKPYAYNELIETSFDDEKLIIIFSHSVGTKGPTYGVARETGVRIKKRTLIRLVYDFEATTNVSPKLKSFDSMFEDTSEDRIEVHPTPTGELFVIKHSTNDSVLTILTSNLTFREDVVIHVPIQGRVLSRDPFIFNTSFSAFIKNSGELAMYDTKASLQPTPFFKEIPDLKEIRVDNVFLTDDLKNLVIVDEDSSHSNYVYDRSGKREPKLKGLREQARILGAENEGGQLIRLFRDDRMHLIAPDGKPLRTIDASGEAIWHPSGKRVLFVPFRFDLFEKPNFEVPLTLWDYTNGTSNSFQLNFEELENAIRDRFKDL